MTSPIVNTHDHAGCTPRLLPGVEVITLDSSLSIPTYMLISPDGRQWEIGGTLRAIIDAVDGASSAEVIALIVSAQTGETLTTEEVDRVLWSFLAGINVIDSFRDTACSMPTYRAARATSTSFLLFRIPLLKGFPLRLLTQRLQVLFFPRVAFLLILGSLLLHAWCLINYAHRMRDATHAPLGSSMLAVCGYLAVSFVLHELGHASACEYFGAAEGEIGFGVYICFPVLYADVSYAWRLRRTQRAVVDLAGIYFQVLAASIMLVFYTATDNAPLLWSVIAINLSVVPNLNPFLKLDGYWFLSDILGVPNLSSRCGELLRHVGSPIRHFGSGIAASIYGYTIFTLCYLAWFLYNILNYILAMAAGEYRHLLFALWLATRYEDRGLQLYKVLAALGHLLGPTVVLGSIPFVFIRNARTAQTWFGRKSKRDDPIGENCS